MVLPTVAGDLAALNPTHGHEFLLQTYDRAHCFAQAYELPKYQPMSICDFGCVYFLILMKLYKSTDAGKLIALIKHPYCFSFHVNLLPINDNAVHFVIITWTNDGGVFELIIDGMLQSSLSGIETNGKISGQKRFIFGSNFYDHFHNLNVWDKVCISLKTLKYCLKKYVTKT